MVALKTILLVENDPVALKMYRDRLQREGFNVETAEDGRAGLKILMDVPIDLLILDIMLPKLSGADVLNYMRMIPALEEVPVIVLSNAPESAVAEEVMAKGPTKRLVKADCTFPMLLEVIQQMLPLPAEKAAASTDSGSAATASPVTAAQSGRVDRPSPPPANRAEVPAVDGTFPKGSVGEMPKIREHCFAYLRAPASPDSQQHLLEFQRRVHSVGKDAAKSNAAKVSILANALDTLLSEINSRRSALTPSMLQTIAQATDCLDSLLRSKTIFADPLPKVAVLAVDDDAICNRVMASALKRTSFDATIADDPHTALKLLETNHYDLILLDVNMPGLTGFELCNKLRCLPHYKSTPVVFITAQNDLGNRKQSVLSGGDDFIPKPIVPSELVLKLTVHLCRSLPQRETIERQESVSAKMATNAPAAAEAGSQNSSGGQMVATVRPSLSRSNDPAQVVGEEPRGTEALEPARSEAVFANETKGAPQAASPATERPANTIVIMPSTVTQTIHTPGNGDEGVNLQAAQPAPPTARREPDVATQDQLTDQLRALRNERDELGGKLEAEIQTAGGLRKEVSDLQTQIRTSADALEKSNAGLQKKSEEIASAHGALEQSQKLAKEREAWCSRLREDVTRLQKDRDELSKQLVAEQSSTTKSNHEVEALRRHTAELDLIKKDLQEQSAEKSRTIAETSERLNAATVAREKAELALKNREAQCAQLDEKLTALRQEIGGLRASLLEREQAAARLAQEAKGQQEKLQGLEKINTDLNQQFSKQTQSASELKQELNTSVEKLAQARKALREQEVRCGQLESDLTVLKQEGSELRSQVAAEKEMSSRSGREMENLQQALRRREDELESARANVQQAVADKTLLESELRRELKAMIDRTAQMQERRAEDEVRCRLLNQDVLSLRQERDEDRRTLRAREEAAVRSREEAEQRQTALQQRISELERARIELERELSEQTRSGAALREELNATVGSLNLTKEAFTEKEIRCTQQDGDLAALKQQLNELSVKWTAERQSSTGLRLEMDELGLTLQHRTAELDSVRAEAQQKMAEWERLELELRSHIRTAGVAIEQLKKSLHDHEIKIRDLTQEVAVRLLERDDLRDQLVIEQGVSAELRRQLDGLRRALQQITAELELAKSELERVSAERSLSSPASLGEQNAAQTDLTQPDANVEQQAPERSGEPANAATPSSPDQNAVAALISATVPEPQVFRLIAPGAGSVLLIGEFTDWQTRPIPMQKETDKSWVATVDLKPGSYQYLFVVDGAMHSDAECPSRIANPFGGHNSVRRVV